MKNVIRRFAAIAPASFVAAFAFTGTAKAANATMNLMWFNRDTGEVSTWQLNGCGNVLSKQDVDWHCEDHSGCASQWQIVDLVR